ncbi:MAG: hypothetical protein A3D31_14040 [Candidatus Fluviicola riflensis]|nr:MAG: hypothetical protein A3D31_14040 [Candidatus Fluviicola riflensis]OGS85163.1 MAG: hypothetical protein A2724_10975 [Fluviicola sp. RIFCSPHIGHO2_01_FULL_43_53]OGS89434.1 MAG: hypothetical protein A3E30_05280 [Fluviicola sp. RIFCSPHIGHO2_12_FULL_43_24]
MTQQLSDHTLDYLMEGFQLISFDWRYLYLNDSVVRQSMYPRDELIGFTMMEKYPGIENTELFSTLRRCMRKRISEQIENEFSYPSGEKGWFELHIQPVPEGIFILSIDITRRKEAEASLMKLNENLEELVASRTSQLESKNKDIIDSLNYAQNIQKAFLPNRDEFLNLFPDALLINKPKDIVSGDFYWYRDLGDEIITVAADCTGHGVPGALMSMIGIEKLNNITLKTTDPSEILHQLNKSIRIAMGSSSIYEQCLDGMDIALCLINKITGSVTFSGANRPAWIIRKDASEVEVIKATKKAIGGFTEHDQCFDSHELQLASGDTLYLFSDGYADTFSDQQKKMTTKRFREFLLEIQHETMRRQEELLENFVEQWKAGTEQIDDILVVGIRF